MFHLSSPGDSTPLHTCAACAVGHAPTHTLHALLDHAHALLVRYKECPKVYITPHPLHAFIWPKPRPLSGHTLGTSSALAACCPFAPQNSKHKYSLISPQKCSPQFQCRAPYIHHESQGHAIYALERTRTVKSTRGRRRQARLYMPSQATALPCTKMCRL